MFHAVFAVTVLAILIHLVRTRDMGFHAARVVELSLLYFLALCWGAAGALLALPHILFPDYVASFIGWDPGSPFQVELGFASLGTSIVSILCIWFRGWFWLAPIVAKSVFLLGAAYVHLHDIAERGNLAPGNAGPVLFYDIALPLLVVGLFIVHVRQGGIERAATIMMPLL